jgi:MFS family permease
VFVGCVIGCGLFLVLAASMSSLGPSAFAVVGFGVCGGGVYVLGFSLIQVHTRDELRGRTFATLYTLVRFCVLLAFVAGPLLSRALDALPISTPGTRLTLWLGGAIIVAAGLLAQRTLARSAGVEPATS